MRQTPHSLDSDRRWNKLVELIIRIRKIYSLCFFYACVFTVHINEDICALRIRECIECVICLRFLIAICIHWYFIRMRCRLATITNGASQCWILLRKQIYSSRCIYIQCALYGSERKNVRTQTNHKKYS